MKNKKAFTLIELLVVISIMWIMMLASYANYWIYQNKASLRLASRELSQVIYDAKSTAIYWASKKDEETWEEHNQSIWILLSKEEAKNNKIKYFKFDYNTDKNWNERNWKEKKCNLDDIIANLNYYEPEKEIELQKNTFITDLPASSILLIFDAVTWDYTIYYINGFYKEKLISNDCEDAETQDKFNITLSYWNQENSNNFLQKKLTYYLTTNIVDYEN